MESPVAADTIVEMYRRAARIRAFEERACELSDLGEISGTIHTAIGQEGEIVGACLALEDRDFMTGNHRAHGHPIAKGAELGPLMAELLGRRDGVCGGKGGSMHIADFAVGSLGETGIVGGGLPLAVGAGLSAQVRGTDQVCLCFFGDGAVNGGTFHESLNLAAIWRLPVIFLCENNGYAITTASHDVTSGESIAAKGAAYGIPGIAVDGQDAVAVHDVVADAVARARRGEGPTLVEARTHRYEEHCHGVPVMRPYRSDAELADWKARDPLTLLRRQLVASGALTDRGVDELDEAARAAVEEATAFALRSELPPAEAAYTDVFASSPSS